MSNSDFHTKVLFEGGNNYQRIGASSTIIEHENEKGDIIRVMYDLGALFPPEDVSADAFVPDIVKYLGFSEDDYLQTLIPSKAQRTLLKGYHHDAGGRTHPQLDALFVTHMHEDHLGGIVNLCKAGFVFPTIYGSIETMSVLGRFLSQAGIERMPQLVPIQEQQPVKINNDFIVTPFYVSHSVVGAFGFHTLTKANGQDYAGLINMGDFNLSEVPLGKGYDEDSFKAFIKDKFITHIFADSTSTMSGNKAFTVEPLSFEDAQKNYESIMDEHKNERIISAVISRSFQNMCSIIRAAKEQNRHVYVDGYMQRIVYDELQRLGSLDEFKDVVYNHDNIGQADLRSFMSKYEAGQQVIIFSGAFAEGQNYGNEKPDEAKMSGLVRISNSKHKNFNLDKNSIVVLGQRAIPVGTVPNRMKVMANKLSSLNGGKIIQNEVPDNASLGDYKMLPLQRSGHANHAEMLKFLQVAQENRANKDFEMYVIPVHGDTKQLSATTQIARRAGAIPVICFNGDVIGISSDYDGIHKLSESPMGTRKWLAFEEITPAGASKSIGISLDIYEETVDKTKTTPRYKKLTRLAQVNSIVKGGRPQQQKNNYSKGYTD